jgi:uncharacterized coiled-coil protein SlyX
MPAVITLQDPSLYERLVRMLPRPDYPIDELLRRLIEQPAKISAERLAELERRAAELERGVRELADAIKGLATALEEIKRAVEAVRGALEGGAACNGRPYIALLVPARLEEPHGDGSQAAGEAPQPKTASRLVEVALQLARERGGCVRYSELSRAIGRRLGSRDVAVLAKNGFYKREKGLYCIQIQ